MPDPQFKKIIIFGVGLIGGSFSLALARAKAVEKGGLIGFSRTATYQKKSAVLQRIVDHSGTQEDLTGKLNGADLILLAVPVGQTADVLKLIKPHLGKDTIITDAGSTKSDVVAAARSVLGDKVNQFVPGHPIAGAELSGPEAATADLYQGKKVVLTPLPENSKDAIARVRKAWELCGAVVSELTAQQHDTVFAAVSHLPHLLSFALVHDLAQRDNRDQLLSFAASGFRDFTRIAASSPEMWRDICLANREALLKEMQIYIAELNRMSAALAAGDAEQLEKTFRTAHELRAGWTEK
ncbi:MAG: prephenate dehydrogenase/arogenate dehydrogenase family protein [Nitrosomonadales bacterium]|nr:prephenate dehydrogenase/arogenate dehydrogenase family protein [Nitrosomonadales bacterium]